ncbi:auxin-responsive protein IAA14-like [Oryza brachyantha]|uniref:Auxin-responsive protein n=1 Tax=Oryza brachyantha TaxID=4533 RepID=J3LTQ9_ORYBR|nr:auxin-responsive protein IAA14-like [Oryza brachyantha]
MDMAESIDAELRLGLPGSGGGDGGAAKKRRSAASTTVKSEASGTAGASCRDDDGASPASKVQVVGWPPVGSYRRSTFQSSSSSAAGAKAKGGETEGKKKKGTAGGGLYVKVSMDGAPYLRKVDLRLYGGYRELRDALDALFGCFSASPADASAAGHFAVAYEDKDGDLMLAGDVPWDMFICSCKKLRIMRGSEAR